VAKQRERERERERERDRERTFALVVKVFLRWKELLSRLF